MANQESDTKKSSQGKSLKSILKGIAGVLSGVIVGVIMTTWQGYWQRPILLVEISEIEREISQKSLVALDSYPDINILKEYVHTSYYNPYGTYVTVPGQRGGGIGVEPTYYYPTISGQSDAISVPVQYLETMLDNAKKESKELPDKIETMRGQLDELKQLKIENMTLNRLKTFDPTGSSTFSIEYQLDINRDDFISRQQDIESNQYYFQRIKDDLIALYEKNLTRFEDKVAKLKSNLLSAEKKVEEIGKDFLDKHSFFSLTVSITNSGKSSTSIKIPALLRVYIGTGNYVDLKLQLVNFKENSQIPAHGTQIMTFASDEISSFPENDQNLINTYWGQSVHSTLFVEDSIGIIHASNKIAFAEGLYQKIIYDRLSTEASKDMYFQNF